MAVIPFPIKKVSFRQIFENDIYQIGLGKNDDGDYLLCVRAKAEGISWHYNLYNDFLLAIEQFD